VSIEKDFQTYESIAEQVEVLAAQLKGEHFDVMLVITRGGMIPGAILGYRLGLRNILIAAVEFYDDPLLEGKRVLVVDEVWDSGRTIQAVDARVRMAGGEPITAVLHYKPGNSEIEAKPDYYIKATNAWIVYPWSKHEKI
jgi:uncharacterized protein